MAPPSRAKRAFRRGGRRGGRVGSEGLLSQARASLSRALRREGQRGAGTTRRNAQRRWTQAGPLEALACWRAWEGLPASLALCARAMLRQPLWQSLASLLAGNALLALAAWLWAGPRLDGGTAPLGLAGGFGGGRACPRELRGCHGRGRCVEAAGGWRCACGAQWRGDKVCSDRCGQRHARMRSAARACERPSLGETPWLTLASLQCEFARCPSNCSWPAGACDAPSGACACAPAWGGADCSVDKAAALAGQVLRLRVRDVGATAGGAALVADGDGEAAHSWVDASAAAARPCAFLRRGDIEWDEGIDSAGRPEGRLWEDLEGGGRAWVSGGRLWYDEETTGGRAWIAVPRAARRLLPEECPSLFDPADVKAPESELQAAGAAGAEEAEVDDAPLPPPPRAEPPREKPTCSLVGNGGSLLLGRAGLQIDAAAAVMRFNYAPTDGFEAQVGARATAEVLNHHHALRLAELTPQGWAWRKGTSDEAGAPTFVLYESLAAMHVLVEIYEAHPSLRVLVASPAFSSRMRGNYAAALANLRSLGLGCFDGDKPMSGIYGLALALNACGKVTVYGVDPWTDSMAKAAARASKAAAKTSNPTERARVAANIAVPYHYFDAEQPRQGAHDFDGAWLLMKALNASQSAPLALVAPDATGHSAVFNAEVVA